MSRWLPQVPAEVTGRERTFAAMRLRSDAYLAWLADNELTNEIGQPLRGWDTITFRRWEEQQASK
ncbi:hypothetical protein ACGFIU_16410 [Rhodococcus oryzae]|uniref:hypothetical protein n=1 Tax=Rhodococcus oryzae TaxID=2571143 RepID=UPI0037216126